MSLSGCQRRCRDHIWPTSCCPTKHPCRLPTGSHMSASPDSDLIGHATSDGTASLESREQPAKGATSPSGELAPWRGGQARTPPPSAPPPPWATWLFSQVLRDTVA